MVELEQAKQRLEELGLDQASAMLEAQLEKAPHEQPTYLTFLNELLEVERAARQKRNLEVRTKLAHLPNRKTLEEFDFSFQPSIDERPRVGHDGLCSPRKKRGSWEVSFSGGTGCAGHYSGTVCVLCHPDPNDRGAEACIRGEQIGEAVADLCPTEDPFERRSWLLPLDRASANLLFQVISARYELSRIVLTSNKGLSDWGELMGDPILATAILDRLLHHSHVLNIRGNSYRLRDKMRIGAYSQPKTT